MNRNSSRSSRYDDEDNETVAEGEPEKNHHQIPAEENDYMEPVNSSGGHTEEPDELPPANLTRSMLAKFQSMENRQLPPPSPARSEVIKSTTVVRNVSVNRNVHQMENNNHHNHHHIADNEYELSAEGYYETLDDQEHIYESVDDDDLAGARRHDTVDDGLPGQGTTRNLLAKFQSLQSSAK